MKYPEYTWVYSKVLQMVLRRLDADYKSFFARWRRGDLQARPPRFKGKHYFTTLCYNQSGFNLDVENQRIRFAHRHPSGVELEFELPWLLPLNGRVKQVELFPDRRRRWFVAIIFEVTVPTYVDNGRYQAIDLGVIILVSAVNLMVRFLLQQPPVNEEPLQDFLRGLHRHTALPQVPRVVNSMKAPAWMQG